MNIIDDKKLSLFFKLIISYALLLNLAFLFYVFNTDPASDQTAKGAVLTNLLVWTATLFTPVAAFFFYDSWKEQKNYEFKKEILIKLNDLAASEYIKILKKSRSADRLKKIKDEIIILSDFNKVLESMNNDIFNEMYALAKIHQKLTGKSVIIDLKEKFDLNSFEIVNILSKLEIQYNLYYKKLNLESSINNQYRSYKKGEKDVVTIEINEINYLISKKFEFYRTDLNGIDHYYEITYDEAVNRFTDSYNLLLDKIVSEIKL
ncbi:hypothetical protein [Acinetobacter zhairhuonensis]|uniref:hypothetical protein n=1 Tax=Acinetobacter sp. A7.4 TaxID=2919921 RepID=UPI001F4FC033|nr:hypothetical protein [Acinetobacter sp. A7.4]MCJ8163137.1 hypothetical protein [Acinetobacter sp. A7.4]